MRVNARKDMRPVDAEVVQAMRALQWPGVSVCGLSYCPHPRYCIECHMEAWNAKAHVGALLFDWMATL